MSRRRLKPDWTWVKFGDVVRLGTERCTDPLASGLNRYVGLEHIESDDLRIRRWGNVADGTTFTNRFRPGQVLFGKRRAYLRKVAVANFEGVCSSDIYVLESRDSAVLLPDLLPFICQTDGFSEYAVGTSAGSLSPRTNWKQLELFEFALPPASEQSKLSKALWAVDNFRQSIADVFQSALQVFDSARATWVCANQPGESKTIGDIARLKIDRHDVLTSQSYHIAGVYSFGRGLLDRGIRTGAETKYKQLHCIHEGQVVLSKLKAWEGAVAVVDAGYESAFVSPEYPTFELQDGLIDPDYMKLICESPWFWANITSLSQGTAERRARINPADFLNVPIYVPSISEQRAIIARVESIKRAVNYCRDQLDGALNLKRALLSNLLGS